MFQHEKQLFHPVGVEGPNPQYAALLQEQLGGANGELKAAMQYLSQSFRIKDQKIKDLFLDIAAEELGHMEMVAQTINLLYFLPTAGMGLLSHGKSGLLEKSVLRSAIPAGLIAAALAAWLSFSVDTELLRRPFGVYLLAAGICILLQKPTKP